jgi:hypothetical protein
MWRIIGGLGALIFAWYALASFLAFHAMFDRSNLLSGTWHHGLIAQPPARWVQISVCLEETTLPMNEVFPRSEGLLLDLFNSDVMTEPAVTRARKMARTDLATAATPGSLPVDDLWADLSVVTLAAHEIRAAAMREQLFRELRRITSSDGSIIVVEHLRNLAAFIAFGPGLFHFHPRSEWIRLAKQAELSLQSETSITPFVHVFRFTPDKMTEGDE